MKCKCCKTKIPCKQYIGLGLYDKVCESCAPSVISNNFAVNLPKGKPVDTKTLMQTRSKLKFQNSLINRIFKFIKA